MLLKIFLVIVVYAMICLYDLPALIRDRSWRELTAFCAFLLPALALSILQAVGIKLPFIIPAIYSALSPLLTWLGIN